MIRVTNLKLNAGHSAAALTDKLRRQLKLSPSFPLEYTIVRQSVDARDKNNICFVYTVDVRLTNEQRILNAQGGPNITRVEEEGYRFPEPGPEPMKGRPVIVGAGPAGLFCAYFLAKNGYAPLLLERGGSVEERTGAVSHFWETGELDEETNVSFGEGGAGTFSDGKLNTGVKEESGRQKAVMELFVRFGAPPEILFLQKPHIGTDILRTVISSLRREIERLGGQVRFHSCFTDYRTRDSRLTEICTGRDEWIPCSVLVLATGHSARDTFTMLSGRLPMEQKAFAVGLRIEHPQEMITRSQYGDAVFRIPESAESDPLWIRAGRTELKTASYKLTARTAAGRAVYSFCMCPGGYVVNASSEKGRLCVNGMSDYRRDSSNANSALVVAVTPEDFGGSHVLAGMEFQRRLEEKAFALGQGSIPLQLLGDFAENKVSAGLGDVIPQTKGSWRFANLRELLPPALSEALLESIPVFDRKIRGFGRSDAVFTGIESRTSSPVRILRSDTGETCVQGIYPCGEGAGYAGGITSAAVDGIRVAEWIARRYSPQKGC